MQARRSITVPFLCTVAGVAATVFTAVAAAADGPGVIRLRPGQWQTTSQLWLDGQPVLRDIEAAANDATQQVLAQARAQMSAEERATLDRLMPPRGSIVRDTECITPEQARIDTRAALREAMNSMHAAPWSCTFSGEQASSRGYFLQYSCTTSGGGRAEGNARAMVNGDAAYTVSIEGRSHAVNNATGRPLEPRMMDARLVNDGAWTAEQCAPEDEDAESGSDTESGAP